MPRGLVDSPDTQIAVYLDAGHQRPIRFKHTRDARRNLSSALGVARQRVLGDSALAPNLEPPGDPRLAIAAGPGRVIVVRMHPQLAAGAIDDWCGLAPVVGVSVGACDQPDMLDAEVDLLERALELGHRTRLMHAGVDEHD